MQTARDTYNQIEYAKKKGREEGRMEGLEEGIEKRSREIAINMLNNGIPVQTISTCTGLSEEEVAKIQSEA